MTSKTLPLVRHEFTNNLDAGTNSGLAAFKLAPGHFITAQAAMVGVYPRPDSETGSFSGTVRARHRWAYYDGVNAIQYEIPVKVYAGAGPHIYELVVAPVGATIGNVRDAANHGIVKWTPTQTYSTSSPAQFLVRVYGQDIVGFIEISWTVATSSSTAQFVFLDNVNGSDSNPGTIDLPFGSLAKLTGATTTTTTYPGRQVYIRGKGTPYLTVAHTDATNQGNASETIKSRIELSATYHPLSFIAYPGEAVSINFAGAQFKIKSSDFSFGGSSTAQMTIMGSANNAAETHNFWIEGVARGIFQWMTFDGFVPRHAGNFTNPAPIFSPYSGSHVNRKYWVLHGVNEINRTVAHVNDAMLHVLFGTDYVVTEYCNAQRTSYTGNAGGVQFKDTNYHTSVRYCDYRMLNANFQYGFSFSDQAGGGFNEITYSKIQGSVWFNLQSNVNVDTGKHYVGRCSIYTTDTEAQTALRAWSSPGPFTAENCVLMSNGPLIVNALITSTGNECHKANASGDLPMLTTDFTLKNSTTQYRNLYLGTRGWEIQ